MKTIDIKCASCGQTYNVCRNEGLPSNVESISTSFCQRCDGEGERVETYVYKQKKEKSTYIENEDQIGLF